LERFDVIVVGAGAAGMMCAIEAGKRGRRVLVVEHARAAGEKIRISGGGRCNFTNLRAAPEAFLSRNPRFCISALRRYRPADFVALIERHGVAYHEKTLGQLFCDDSARRIVELLLAEMRTHGVVLRLLTSVERIEKTAGGFVLTIADRPVACASLVIASGGKSIPKMGATGFGYEVAAQFGLAVVPTRPALVPLTFEIGMLERLKPLVGIALPVRAHVERTGFEEAMLFTHRGLSGPAILQISSYWREGGEIVLDLAPGEALFGRLRAARAANGRQGVQTVLSESLPRRLAQWICEAEGASGNIADLSDKRLRALADAVQAWRIKPVGSEGYRTAEVTLGGVDTDGLDPRTLEAKAAPGLYFIGEVVDVTGWLGGYNFQWAWSSGWCAGQAV
jgi:predicted Rossmann fold flavoprotein